MMSELRGERGLEARGITVVRDQATLLADVSFRAPAGALTALLGPNGAGKSTLLRAVAGVERPEAGAVHFGGDDLAMLGRRARARRVALVEQDAATELAVTVRETARLGRTPHESWLGGDDPGAAEIVERALELAGARLLADRTIPSLSGGERQRAFLARALAQDPRLLLLDEPTNHLDVAAALDVLTLLERLSLDGLTVVAALHDLSLAAAFADHVVIVQHGRIVAEGPTRATLSPELVREVYGVRAVWLENPLTGRPLLAVAPGTDSTSPTAPTSEGGSSSARTR